MGQMTHDYRGNGIYIFLREALYERSFSSIDREEVA